MVEKIEVGVLTNVIVKANPAVAKIVRDLRDDFSVTIYGSEELLNNHFGDNTVYINLDKQKSVTILILRFLLFFLNQIIKPFEKLKLKKILSHLIVIRLKLTYKIRELKLYFVFNKKTKLLINIDTEAAYISKNLAKKLKIKTFYFVYEFFCEQFFIQKPLYNYLYKVEKQALYASDSIIISVNAVGYNYLKNKFKFDKNYFIYTICPHLVSQNININPNEIKFYYHGAFGSNRGILESIEAFKDIQNATLSFRGYGNLKFEMEALINELNIGHKVFILEPVDTDELSKTASSFDLGLTLVRLNIDNHRYGMGFKTFENISAGCALVLPKTFPLLKMHEDFNDFGFIYEDATVENLSKLFSYIVSNPTEIIKQKEKTLTAYNQEYNPVIQGERIRAEMFKALES